MARTAGSALTTSTVRAIRGLRVSESSVTEQLTGQLMRAIEVGLLAPGQRLPAESMLSEQLGVATLTLREALAALRHDGLIVTTRGRSGGSAVAQIDPAAVTRLRLERTSVYRLVELGDLRTAVFGAAAARAAARANAREIAELERRVRRLVAEDDAVGRGRADAEFAFEVAAASQARRFTAEESRLRAELGDLVWALLDGGGREAAVAGRSELVAAIAKGEPDTARRVAEELIRGETALLIRHRLELYAEHAPSPASVTALQAAVDTALTAELERITAGLESLAGQCAAAIDPHVGLTLEALADLRPAMTDRLEMFDDIAIGLGIVVEPGIVPESAYCMEWWYRDAAGDPTALRVDLDPDSPEFFDYPGEEWFEVPREAARPHAAGPYVDNACTNEYTFTFAVPVVADGRFCGVAAADILCTQIERRVLPALAAYPDRAVLVNEFGRVIASNRADILPSTRLTSGVGLHEVGTRLTAVAGWSLRVA